MLTRDLLRELLRLIDDSETFRTVALASRVTSTFCTSMMEDAKDRFTIRRPVMHSLRGEAVPNSGEFLLPDGTNHGPYINTASWFGSTVTCFRSGWWHSTLDYYYRSGARKSRTHFKNGCRCGLDICWLEDGTLEYSYRYPDDYTDTSTL